MAISCAYTPKQNRRAERKHRHVPETVLAMLFNAHAPASFWFNAFVSAIYIINRLPTKVLDHKSLFELVFGCSPNYNVFRVFGCRVFPYLRDYAPHKLAPRSLECIFLGYDTQYNGYRFLDLATSRIYTTRHAQFDETNFPFSGQVAPIDLAKLLFSSYCDGPSTGEPPRPVSTVTPPNQMAETSGGCCDSIEYHHNEHM